MHTYRYTISDNKHGKYICPLGVGLNVSVTESQSTYEYGGKYVLVQFSIFEKVKFAPLYVCISIKCL